MISGSFLLLDRYFGALKTKKRRKENFFEFAVDICGTTCYNKQVVKR